ncbi:MAG: sugar transferase [Bacteroidales bacterium]
MRKRIYLINKLIHYQIRKKMVLRWLLEFFELLAVLISLPLSFYLTREIAFFYELPWNPEALHYGVYGLLLILFWYAVSQVSLMAIFPRAQRFLNVVFLFSRGYLIIFMLLLLAVVILNLHSVPVLFIVINIGMALVFTLTIRILTMYHVRVYRANGYNLRNILVIGDSCSQTVIDKFLAQKDWGFNIRAIISRSSVLKKKYGREIPVLPGAENITYILESQVVDEVFYCKNRINEEEMRKIISICEEIGVIFRVQTSGATSIDPQRVELKTMNSSGSLTLVDIPSHRLPHDIKSITDILFSLIAIILLAPLFLVIALLIKLDSKGPVLYKQERMGLRGRRFKLYKFRTMVTNAEQMMEKLRAQNEMDGPTFKMKNDPRITPLGRFLRRTSLDEFPQLYNVIRGEMSLIGPRPPLESEVKQYKRWQLRRLSVKPGITCIWQITPQRNDVKFEKWMQMDLNYIDNWSLSTDIALIFKTIMVMIFASGR